MVYRQSYWDWCGRCGSRFRAKTECEMCGPGDAYAKALQDAQERVAAGDSLEEVSIFLLNHRRYHRRAVDYAMRQIERD